MKDYTGVLTRRDFLKLVGSSALAVSVVFRQSCQSVPPLTVGLQVELTGGLATYGYWHLKSARAAIEKVNQEGGIAGRPVRLVYADTETDPATGSRRMRKLILKNNADFVIGSQHSGVCLASLPVSKRFTTPYFPIGEATQITGSQGHEFVFRSNYSVKAHARSGYGWVMDNLGVNWTIIYADYAMGQSALHEWSQGLLADGGRLVDQIPVPQGTDDFGPYLKKVNTEETDVLLIVLYGPDALACIRRSYEMGLDQKMTRFGNTGSVEALDVDFPGAESLFSITNYPRRSVDVPQELQEFDSEFRSRVGVDRDGKGLENGRIVDSSHYWVPWENVHFLRDAAEACDWKGKKDTTRLIKALAGVTVQGSDSHPQGNKYIREIDHQGFHAQYIQQV